MRIGIVLVLLGAFSLAASACSGLTGTDRISEGEADKIHERNDEVGESLPVFADSQLVGDRQPNCEGAFQYDDSTACGLTLTYETGRPLVEVLAFYESYFASDGWTKLDVDSLLGRYFEARGVLVQVSVNVPPLTCPEPHTQPDAARACQESWIVNQGGDYILRISPD